MSRQAIKNYGSLELFKQINHYRCLRYEVLEEEVWSSFEYAAKVEAERDKAREEVERLRDDVHRLTTQRDSARFAFRDLARNYQAGIQKDTEEIEAIKRECGIE